MLCCLLLSLIPSSIVEDGFAVDGDVVFAAAEVVGDVDVGGA